MTDRAAEKYAEQHGQDAADRQKAEAVTRWSCCGELRSVGQSGSGPSHHPLCRQYVEPVVAELVDGQESLL